MWNPFKKTSAEFKMPGVLKFKSRQAAFDYSYAMASPLKNRDRVIGIVTEIVSVNAKTVKSVYSIQLASLPQTSVNNAIDSFSVAMAKLGFKVAPIQVGDLVVVSLHNYDPVNSAENAVSFIIARLNPEFNTKENDWIPDLAACEQNIPRNVLQHYLDMEAGLDDFHD